MSQDSAKNSRKAALALPKPKLSRPTNGSTSRIVTILFLTPGIVSLILSIYVESNTLALVGLGLAFWGALFLFISPKRLVDGGLLYDSVLASYSTLDRIITDFKYKGKGHHIPPYPKDVYLPEHLKGLKDPLVFIPAEDKLGFPSIEEIAESKFLLKNPKGILVSPPGLGFLYQIENKLQTSLSKTNLNELSEILPRSILENLNVAEDIEMTVEGDHVELRITNSVYKDLYRAESRSKSVSILGCPIASAVACIVAKVTGKPVAIQTYKKSPDGLIVQIQYIIEQDLTK
jgi:hypothetical protein